jgi:hypothetical protein
MPSFAWFRISFIVMFMTCSKDRAIWLAVVTFQTGIRDRRLSAGTWTILTGVSWFISVPAKKFQSITSTGTRPLPPKPFTFHNSSCHLT